MVEINIVEIPVRLEDDKYYSRVFAPIANNKIAGIVKLSNYFFVVNGELRMFEEV